MLAGGASTHTMAYPGGLAIRLLERGGTPTGFWGLLAGLLETIKRVFPRWNGGTLVTGGQGQGLVAIYDDRVAG